jgi:hypothetical protein
MGFRAADVVVAVRGISNAVTGNSVTCGTQGVVVKQLGYTPAMYRVRFIEQDGPVILDDVTGRDICHQTPGLDEPIARPAAQEFVIPEQGYLSGRRGQTGPRSRLVPDEGSDLAGQTRRSGGRGSGSPYRAPD